MYIICYKIGNEHVCIHDCRFVCVYASNVRYCDRARELDLLENNPGAEDCQDNLLTVTGVKDDGSMATVYDVVCFEGE